MNFEAKGTVMVGGESIEQIIKQRDNFRAVLEGAEYRNLDYIGNGDITTARQLGELVAAMSKAALDHCGEEGAAAIEEVRANFFAKIIEEALSDS